jgi:hypothetical protein
MQQWLLLVIGLAMSSLGLPAQEKPVIIVQVFTVAAGVEWPYDMKMMQVQTVAELRVMLGKGFDIVTEAPSAAPGNVYSLAVQIAAWRQGNAAKRYLIGFGSGREAADILYRVTGGSGKSVLERKDTIRTNFFSQGAGSVGTLAHPIALKIAARIKAAKLK